MKHIITCCMTFFVSCYAFSQDTTTLQGRQQIVFHKVERESQFRGGEQAWRGFLIKTLVYPAKAMRKNIQGEVMLEFIVDEQGNVYDEQALTGHPLLQKAALDVIRQSPKWAPAEQGGRK